MNMADLNNDLEEMLNKCLKAPHRELLRDILIYNDSLTISQVVKYFGRQGIMFTKPMIQFYVREGIIPPPESKRRYTRLHLLMLAILEQLKSVCSLEDISVALSGLAPGDMLIKRFQDLAVYAVSAWRETLEGVMEKASEAANSMNLDDEQTRRLFMSLVMLGIMTQSAAAKQTALMIGGGPE